MVETSRWMQKVAANPGHSRWYIERFRAMARAGDDVVGEARFVDAMAKRGSRILDAGCGAGRVGGYLASVGHRVVGAGGAPGGGAGDVRGVLRHGRAAAAGRGGGRDRLPLGLPQSGGGAA